MEPEIHHVDPLAGFSPRVGRYITQLDDLNRRVGEYCEGLTPEQLSWYPNEACESIGTQLLHIAAVERSWIGEDIMRRPMDPDEWQYAFPIRRGIPQLQGWSLEQYTHVLDRVRTETKTALAKLLDKDLGRLITVLDAPEDANERFTIEWILYHLVEHEAHHKGQIALLRRLMS